MHDDALPQLARRTTIFAEVDPSQKERVILALRRGGQVVGYLGDGINDAPALHAADVGISVDTAVDVARESADLVLLEHSLTVLRKGIEEGRRVFVNTLKYIFTTTSANFGNMLCRRCHCSSPSCRCSPSRSCSITSFQTCRRSHWRPIALTAR
ncbi:MAG: HAD-IC family P-type ATPase [Burkholderiaceae bacterium]